MHNQVSSTGRESCTTAGSPAPERDPEVRQTAWVEGQQREQGPAQVRQSKQGDAPGLGSKGGQAQGHEALQVQAPGQELMQGRARGGDSVQVQSQSQGGPGPRLILKGGGTVSPNAGPLGRALGKRQEREQREHRERMRRPFAEPGPPHVCPPAEARDLRDTAACVLSTRSVAGLPRGACAPSLSPARARASGAGLTSSASTPQSSHTAFFPRSEGVVAGDWDEEEEEERGDSGEEEESAQCLQEELEMFLRHGSSGEGFSEAEEGRLHYGDVPLSLSLPRGRGAALGNCKPEAAVDMGAKALGKKEKAGAVTILENCECGVAVSVSADLFRKEEDTKARQCEVRPACAADWTALGRCQWGQQADSNASGEGALLEQKSARPPPTAFASAGPPLEGCCESGEQAGFRPSGAPVALEQAEGAWPEVAPVPEGARGGARAPEQREHAGGSPSGVPASVEREGRGRTSEGEGGARALERCECGELVVASRFAQHVLSHFQESEKAPEQRAAGPARAGTSAKQRPGAGTATASLNPGQPGAACSAKAGGRRAQQGRGGGGGRRHGARLDGPSLRTATLDVFLVKRA